MTLRTVTGPTIAAALADARRLFGADAVMLQSAPPTPDGHASVTVAFDEAGPAPAAPTPAPAARPEADAVPVVRAYGYGGARNVRPVAQEPASAPSRPPAAPASGPVVSTSAPVAATASAAEVAELRARLAALETLLAQTQPTVPSPARRPALVLVGPAGSGKTSLALRLGQAPALVGAAAPAVLVVAPEEGLFIDPASAFWGTGVPVAVVRTEADVREALATFADADRIVVDTPSLPLQPERARPLVERLATLLAPLAPLDVHFVADASRPATLSAEAVAALGLRPDALALTRLDEADEATAQAWHDRLGWPLHFTSAGTALSDVATPTAAPRSVPAAPTVEPAPVPSLSLPPAPARRVSSSDYLGALLSGPESAPEAVPVGTLIFAE